MVCRCRVVRVETDHNKREKEDRRFMGIVFIERTITSGEFRI